MGFSTQGKNSGGNGGAGEQRNSKGMKKNFVTEDMMMYGGMNQQERGETVLRMFMEN